MRYTWFLLLFISGCCQGQILGPRYNNTPNEFPNLKYWFAAYKETAYTDNDPVNSPTDFSGNSVSISAPGGTTRRPLYKSNIINGKAIFRFDGSNDLWQAASKTSFDFLHQGSFTEFYVVKQTLSSSSYIFDSGLGNPANIGRTIRMIGGTQSYINACYAGSSPNVVFSLTSANNTLPLNTWHLLVTRYDQNAVGDDALLFIDKSASLTQGSLSPSSSTASNLPVIGAAASLGNVFGGDIAEFFAYDRALSNTEINQIIGSLNIGYRTLLADFIDNGHSVSLSTEATIISGSGGSEYFAFGDILQTSNDRIHLAYRQGVGHNVGTDGHIMYCYSDDGGSTWSSPVQVVRDGNGLYNTGNAALAVTHTGRILLCYTKQDLPTSLLTQQTYLIYSDDGGTTWNSTNGYDGLEIKVSNDIAYMNIIGDPFEVNNILMLPMYSRTAVTSGNEYAMLYQSTDNGLTWTKRSNITDGTSNTVLNAGETCLIRRADGVVLTNMRGGNGTNSNYSTYSLDNGLTWYPKPYQLGNTFSKNAMAISPNGTILTCARDASTSVTLYGYSSDGLKTVNYSRIDSRPGAFMYAGIIWDSFRNHFLIVYFVETGTPFSSPTDIVSRIVNEN